MALQIRDVLEQKGSRPVMVDDLGDLEEQVALILTGKAVRTAERVLLRDACEREGLARKARQQHIMTRDLTRVLALGTNVTGEHVIHAAVRKVREIGLLRPAVPLAGEHALAADCLEPQPHAANTGEQVDEAEG